jgi:glycosyltransferase involved in cell wall biosynthesis
MDKRLKICYLVSSLVNEGPVNVMYNIIKYIDFSKFEVSIITLTPEKENTRMTEFAQFPINIYQLASKTGLNPLSLFINLRKRIVKINPEMLHAHCPRSLYLMAFLPKKYLRVYTIHIYPGYQQEILYGKWKGKLVVLLNHYFTKKCDLPIGCSDSVGVQYKEEKGWNIKCINNGASLPVWQYNEVEKELLRKEFGLNLNMKYFIFIGRLSKEKNPDALVKVFSKIEDNRIGLIVLGDGILFQKLNEVKTDNVIMTGFTNRVYDYLKVSDFYISASSIEGLANTLLESMSVGLPMILSSIPSHESVINNCPQSGAVFNESKEQDLLNLVVKFGSLDISNLREMIQGHYLENYTASKMSLKYQRAYEILLESKNIQ